VITRLSATIAGGLGLSGAGAPIHSFNLNGLRGLRKSQMVAYENRLA